MIFVYIVWLCRLYLPLYQSVTCSEFVRHSNIFNCNPLSKDCLVKHCNGLNHFELLYVWKNCKNIHEKIMCFWLAENKCYFFLSQVQHHGANAKLKHIVVQITNSSCTVKSCLSWLSGMLLCCKLWFSSNSMVSRVIWCKKNTFKFFKDYKLHFTNCHKSKLLKQGMTLRKP